MSDFLQLAQTLTLALKALQMYTAAHPRAREAVSAAHAALHRWLTARPRLQFVVSGAKAFADGVVLDTRNPHVASLVRLVTERAIGGFVFEQGLSAEECLAFLQALASKPQKLEEHGGMESLLLAQGVRHIRVSQVRYQEVLDGEEGTSQDRSPALPVSPAEDPLVKAIREALLASIRPGRPPGTGPAEGTDDLGFLRDFQPSDLEGLGPLGLELGFGDAPPSAAQVGTLRQVLLDLAPEAQLNLLAGCPSLPSQPAGLSLAVKALAGELLAVATRTLLAKGVPWPHLRGPLQEILRPLPDREPLAQALATHLRASGHDSGPVEALLRRLAWEDLSLEARLVKVLEEGHLFELTLDQRLAFLRELLDLRRFDAFLRVQEALLEALRDEQEHLRLQAAQTLAGVARWIQDPGLPDGSEGPLAEGLRAHFAWEPDPPVHRWTAQGLESLLSAQVARGNLRPVLSDLQELEGLCAFLGVPQPWRRESLDGLRRILTRSDLMDAVVVHILALDRHRLAQEVHPYLEFLGAPMARHLVARLGEESDRTRRGRLVEAVRHLGPESLAPLLEALASPAWYLVRNALTLLSDLGDAGCVPDIAPLLRHPESRVRRTAVRALWKLAGPASEPHLLARMKDTDAETLQEILFALGQLKSETGLPQIAEVAQDRRAAERLRVQAIDTLGHIGSPKALPSLGDLLRRKGFFGGVEAPPIRLAAARALLALGDPEALAVLRRVVEAEPRGDDREALQALLSRPGTP